MSKQQSYYVYMLRCEDESIYTGITTDLSRRWQEHFQKKEQCAKYTFHHQVVHLVCAWSTQTRSLASKLEFHIKKLKKQQKEELILKRGSFSKYFASYLKKEDFHRLTNKDLKKIEKEGCAFQENAVE